MLCANCSCDTAAQKPRLLRGSRGSSYRAATPSLTDGLDQALQDAAGSSLLEAPIQPRTATSTTALTVCGELRGTIAHTETEDQQ